MTLVTRPIEGEHCQIENGFEALFEKLLPVGVFVVDKIENDAPTNRHESGSCHFVDISSTTVYARIPRREKETA